MVFYFYIETLFVKTFKKLQKKKKESKYVEKTELLSMCLEISQF